MWKKLMKELNITDSYVSMGLGLLVVLIVGVLLFNYFRGPQPSITPEGETTEEAAGTEGMEGTHTVVAGETLWSIAEKYYSDGYKWSDIAQANKLDNADAIEVGMKLVIPESSVAEISQGVTAGEVSAESTEVLPPTTTAQSTYTVKTGDSLWKIAEALYNDGYRWVDIAQANNLTNPDIIHNGNVLTIPR